MINIVSFVVLKSLTIVMKLTRIILLATYVIFASACIYKTPVQQGNVLVQDDVNEINPGMSKRQIAIILGTPAIADPFNQDRWDYINTFKLKGKTGEIKKLSLFFQEGKLIRTEGNYFPEKNSSTIEKE